MKRKRTYWQSMSKVKQKYLKEIMAEQVLIEILATPVVYTHKPLTSVQMQIMYGSLK